MSQRRLPIYLVIDCSESMVGPAIQAVSEGLGHLFDELRSNPLALETAFLSVITFSREAQQLTPLTDLLSFQPPKLSVRPGTALGAALRVLLESLNKEVMPTTEHQRGDYKPLVFLLTDGQPTDDWESAADAIRHARKPALANIYAIGCGPDADVGVLRRITDIVLTMPDLSTEAYRRFFVWLSASVQTASARAGVDASEGMGQVAALPPGLLCQLSAMDGPSPAKGRQRQIFVHAKCSMTKKTYLIRYVLNPQADVYEAVASHPLEDPASGEGLSMPAISSSMLVGCPPCPYCENAGAAACGCGSMFCLSQNAKDVVCPACNAHLTMGDADINVQLSEG